MTSIEGSTSNWTQSGRIITSPLVFIPITIPSTTTVYSTKKKEEKTPSFLAGLTKALLSALSFFFRRPIRLFRPVKISALLGIQAIADERKEKLYSFKFIRSLIKEEGWRFFPTHILPPLIINSIIGFTLFFTYTTTSTYLLPYFPPPPPSSHSGPPSYSNAFSFNYLVMPFVSGSIAGATSSLISTPLDNAKLLLLQRQTYLRSLSTTSHSHSTHSRSHPRHNSIPYTNWRSLLVNSVFHPLTPLEPLPTLTSASTITSSTRRRLQLQKARIQFQSGFNSFTLSITKDTISFGFFFMLFECGRSLSRMIALDWDGITESDLLLPSTLSEGEDRISMIIERKKRSKTSLILQSLLILLSGGLAGYIANVISRPFDRIRELIWISKNSIYQEIGKESKIDLHSSRTKKRRSERRRVRKFRELVEGLKIGSPKEKVVHPSTTPVLLSTFDLIKNSTSPTNYLKFFFSSTPIPTQPQSTIIINSKNYPKPTRLSHRYHLLQSKSKSFPINSSTSLGFRSLKILSYIPPYAAGLLVYSLMSGDLS